MPSMPIGVSSPVVRIISSSSSRASPTLIARSPSTVAAQRRRSVPLRSQLRKYWTLASTSSSVLPSRLTIAALAALMPSRKTSRASSSNALRLSGSFSSSMRFARKPPYSSQACASVARTRGASSLPSNSTRKSLNFWIDSRSTFWRSSRSRIRRAPRKRTSALTSERRRLRSFVKAGDWRSPSICAWARSTKPQSLARERMTWSSRSNSLARSRPATAPLGRRGRRRGARGRLGTGEASISSRDSRIQRLAKGVAALVGGVRSRRRERSILAAVRGR